MPTDSPVLTWIPPGTDEELVLMSGVIGRRLLRGVTGLGALDVEIITDDSPLGGVAVRGTYRPPRTIILPSRVTGSTHAIHIQRMRETIQAYGITDEDGAGTLRVARPDGTRRQIAGYFRTGIPDMNWRWDSFAPVIFCPEPWFSDVDEIGETYAHVPEADVDFLDPFPSISPGQQLGSATVTNDGDLTAWPTWTITGPATAVTIVNGTTGESFIVNPDFAGGGPMLAGDTLTITTYPPTVRGPEGEVWTGALNWPGAVLWGFKRGANEVEFTVDGADAGTSVSYAYRRLWRSA